MATALDLITDAGLMAGTLGHGESYGADEAAYALRRLNGMLETWSLEHLACYDIVEQSLSLVAGTATYNLSTRPNDIEYVFVSYGSVDYECTLISADDYAAIGVKTIQGLPRRYRYERAYPTGILTFWLVPFSTMTAKVGYRAALQSFAALSTTVTLPPGYSDAIIANLAILLSVGKDVPAWVQLLAVDSKAAIQRPNVQRTEMRTDIGGRRGLFNIYSGTNQ